MPNASASERGRVRASARKKKPSEIPLFKGVSKNLKWKSRGGITVPPLFHQDKGSKMAPHHHNPHMPMN